ncbi:MAG: co-chaperone GroES [Marinilabiliales bacterium]|nr:MAG: co-chaperone GroES [Marinilabiliales bacterium]
MSFFLDNQDSDKFIVIGDRVLLKPKSPQQKTRSGLFLPPGFEDKQKVGCGYVIKSGPGYPIPSLPEIQEPWKKSEEKQNYFPLQVKPGDLAVFLQESSYLIEFNKEKYVIVPHSGILMLIRDEDLLE